MTSPSTKNIALSKTTHTKALIALGMVCFLWGTTWIASRQGVQHMPAWQLAGIRQSIGGLLYLVYFISKKHPWPKGKEWRTIVILSLLNFFLSNGLSTWGVKYISAGLGAIIAATFPLWIVIINLFTAKTKIPLQALTGLLLGFAGVCIIFYDHLHDFLNADFRLGIIISVAAAWTWALGTMYTKQKAAAFNPYFSLGLQMLISGIATTIIAQSTGNVIPVKDIPWQSWTAIGYLAIFGSVISFIAYLYALQHLHIELASIYAYVNPIVAVILGALLFNEHITIVIAIGGAVILYGVYLINKVFRKTYQEEGEEI
ncbi:MAG: EamA family transporter [Chitinophagaceae bacterium]